MTVPQPGPAPPIFSRPRDHDGVTEGGAGPERVDESGTTRSRRACATTRGASAATYRRRRR